MRDVSRRTVLQTVLAGTATATLPGVTAAADDGPTSSEIPAPFDEMPTLTEASERQREFARTSLPPRAVPNEGEIPDHSHTHTVKKDVEVPQWAVEAACWRLLERHNPEDLDRWQVEELLIDYVHIEEQFVTADGGDAVSVILNKVRGGSDDA